MSEIVLYRKYRSTNFDNIIGQEHVVTTLKNAVKSKEVGHAYLFSGSRGIGKTSIARILARAVNCRNIENDYNPCNICENCQAILQQSTLDVVEIDAASHRGIDDIRFLQEGASFAPVMAKKKVFIIDEVHMLTKEAFNALLKTLEEPPDFAMFILATTEIEKVPETIISRCQNFYLHRLSEKQIAAHMVKIVTSEGAEIDEEAAMIIGSSVKGSMRDALGVLEKLLVLDQKKITKESVWRVMGVVEKDILEKLTGYILKGDVKAGLEYYLGEVYYAGVDVFRLINSLETYWRDLILQNVKQNSPQSVVDNLMVMLDELQQMREKNYEIDSLYFEIFLIGVVKKINPGSINDVTVTENIIPEEKKDVSNTKEINLPKIGQMEKKVEESINSENIVDNHKFDNISEDVVREKWGKFVVGVCQEMPLVGSILKMSEFLGIVEEKLVIGVNFALQKNQLESIEYRNRILEKIGDVFGSKLGMDVKVVSNGDYIKKKRQQIENKMNDQVNESTGEKLLQDVLQVFGGEVIRNE